MKKRILIVLFSFCLIFVSIKVYAVLPALLFAESVIEMFVIRSAAKQVIATVGTAANDASWVSTFTSWFNAARVVGSVVVHSQGKIYEVQIATPAVTNLTYAAVNSYVWRVWQSVPASASVDHVEHVPNLPFSASPQLASAAWIAWAQTFVPGANLSIASCEYSGTDAFCAPVDWSLGWYGGTYLNSDLGEDIDGIKRIIGTPGNWSADSDDPDWTPAEIAQLKNSPSLRFTGATGTNAVLDFAGTAQGLSLQYKQAVSPTVLRTLSLATDAVGVPASVTVFEGAGVVTDPVASSSTTTPPATVQFPNDYARAGEAASAANLLSPKLDTLHKDLSDTSTVADPLAVDPTTMPSFGNTFNNLKSWNLPAHASTCPAPNIDLSGVFGAGHVYAFNAHCQLVQDHFAALQAAMMVCWSIMAMFVVLRA